MCTDAPTCISYMVATMQQLGILGVFQGVLAAMLIVGLTIWAVMLFKR